MNCVVSRTIRNRSGIVATVRRPLQLPFVPPIGATLLYGRWTVVVKEITIDVETAQVVIVDEDDCTLFQHDRLTHAMVEERMAQYVADGWTAARNSTDPRES
jgi:hypothetical protein